MFKSLLGSLEATAENAISRILTRLLAFIPFVIAAGFATAAATVKLTELYGSLIAYGLVAVAYLFIGLLAAIPLGFSATPNPQAASEPAVSTTASPLSSSVENNSSGNRSRLDPELMMAAATSVAPSFVPIIARAVVRNLPLLAAVALLLLVLYGAPKARQQDSSVTAE